MSTVISSPIVELRLSAAFIASVISGSASHRYNNPLTVGSAAGQVNKWAVVEVSVVDNVTPTIINLQSVQDIGGSIVNFSALTHYAFNNLSDTVGEDFTLGGGANPIIPADPQPVPPINGAVMRAMPNLGLTVDSTHKNFQLAIAAGAAVEGLLTLIGR